jgi:hypothetical protein
MKIENIENEMDIRVESLISEIQKYRDDYQLELNQNKEDYQVSTYLRF